MTKDTAFKILQRTNALNFLKWGEYMKRANIAERKVDKLKALLLLTDPALNQFAVSDITILQWQEYLKEFPEERD